MEGVASAGFWPAYQPGRKGNAISSGVVLLLPGQTVHPDCRWEITAEEAREARTKKGLTQVCRWRRQSVRDWDASTTLSTRCGPPFGCIMSLNGHHHEYHYHHHDREMRGSYLHDETSKELLPPSLESRTTWLPDRVHGQSTFGWRRRILSRLCRDPSRLQPNYLPRG